MWGQNQQNNNPLSASNIQKILEVRALILSREMNCRLPAICHIYATSSPPFMGVKTHRCCGAGRRQKRVLVPHQGWTHPWVCSSRGGRDWEPLHQSHTSTLFWSDLFFMTGSSCCEKVKQTDFVSSFQGKAGQKAPLITNPLQPWENTSARLTCASAGSRVRMGWRLPALLHLLPAGKEEILQGRCLAGSAGVPSPAPRCCRRREGHSSGAGVQPSVPNAVCTHPVRRVMRGKFPDEN